MPSPLISLIVSAGLISPFTYMCTYFHHSHPTTPFPYTPPSNCYHSPQLRSVLTSCSPFL
jgi:hypothetical protein